MPVTPLHLGPAMLVKAAAPRLFSLLAFALVQVMIDLEPLYYMLAGEERLHRLAHTWIGATLIAVLAVPVCRRFGPCLLAWWNGRLSSGQHRWLGTSGSMPARAAWTGALLGAWSHILLDSFMHADMHPWAPFSDANGLLYRIAIEQIEWLCIVAGALGAGLLLVRFVASRARN